MSQKILITGGAGFIGSHLAKELADRGYRVRVLDCFSPQVHGGSKKLPEILPPSVEVLEGDVRSRKDVLEALRGVSAVYHLAASVGVGQSMYEVESYVGNNNGGTATLLQALIDHPVERLIVASSMSIYGEGLYRDRSGLAYPEVRRELEDLKRQDWEPHAVDGSPLEPIPTPENKRPDLASIYALSKFDQERMALLIGRAYQIPTVALRFFNVYGRGQALSNPYTGVIAIFASRLLNAKPALIFEDGNQMRDFVHVSDVARACRLALEVPQAAGQVFNIGSGEHYTIREIAQKVGRAMGRDAIAPEITSQYRVGDIRHCFADISLARKVLGYGPRVTLADGLSDLVHWLSSQRADDHTEKMRRELDAKGLAI